VADARVVDPDHLAADGANLLDRGLHVCDPQPDSRSVRLELLAVGLRVPEGECDVRGLDLSVGVFALSEAQHVAVPGHGPTSVTRRDRHEVDLLDLHHGSEPSL
jgi:hypothetical protein